MTKTVGTIGLDMVLHSAKFTQQLHEVRRQTDSVAAKLEGSFKKLGAAIAAAFSVAMIKKFGQQAIENAAGVQAANSQLTQTFGELEGSARTAMQAVAKESGILETRLQGVGTGIYAFAKASGMKSAEALNMMKETLYGFFGSLLGSGLTVLITALFSSAIENVIGLPFLLPSALVMLIVGTATVALTVAASAVTAAVSAVKISKIDTGLILRGDN